MIVKYLLSVGLSAAVTATLLLGMQFLIAGNFVLPDNSYRQDIIWVPVRQPVPLERRNTPPERPPEVDTPPITPRLAQDSIKGGDVIYVLPNDNITIAIPGNSPSWGMSDGDLIPLAKVLPAYPRRAEDRGIEGHVVVEFTVTATGSVRDVVVIESSSSIFDKAAMDAASKFKYRPRVVNGEAVEVQGVQHLITFELPD